MELPVVDRWFTAVDASHGVTRLDEPWVDPFLVSNVWHVRGTDRDLLVDAANGIGPLRREVDALAGERPVVAVVTHAHFDHVGGLREFDDRRCHEADADMPTPGSLRLMRTDFPAWLLEDFAYYGASPPEVVALRGVPDAEFDLENWSSPDVAPTSFVSDGDVIDLGNRAFEVLHTPGHTPGSICLWEESSGTLFSGDAIYVDDRLGWEDPEAFASSLRRLLELSPRIVHGGHGRSFGVQDLARTVEATLRELESR